MTVKRSVEEYSFDTVAVCAKILLYSKTVSDTDGCSL